MFGLDTKSLIVGLALGYFILPKITAMVVGKMAAGKATPKATAK